MTTDEYNDDTTPLEYFITGLVILLFGLLYFLINYGWDYWSNSSDRAILAAAPVLEEADTGIRSSLSLTPARDIKPEKSAPEVKVDTAAVEKIQAEKAALEVESTERLQGVQTALKQAEQEGMQAQELIRQQGEKERLQAETIARQQQEIARLKAEAAEREHERAEAERIANELAQKQQEAEALSMQPVIVTDTDRLVFELPGGSNVIVPDDGFEGAVKDAMVKRRLNDPMHFDAIQFESGSARLSRASGDQIQAVAALMNTYKDIRILIRGHTDNTGGVNANSILSLTRSVSMKNALSDLGIDPQRIEIEGVGQLEPIASNDTAEGRKQNRRIELILVE